MSEDRNFSTKFSFIIDTETGPVDGEIDLTQMSERDLHNLVPTIPEAMMELVYRDLILNRKPEEDQ